jgi:hypothetical protein
LAPALSISETSGSLLCSAISWVRRLFLRPIGAIEPPLIALSLAPTMQRTPLT